MSTRTSVRQQLIQAIQVLPEHNLADLVTFVDFLRFKLRRQRGDGTGYISQLADLKGILKGYDFSPEFIAGARSEIWAGFGRESL